MTKKEIAEQIRGKVARRLGKGYTVTTDKTVKTNDVVLTAIQIEKAGESISPRIYIDELTEEIRKGKFSTDAVAEFIAEKYNTLFPDMQTVAVAKDEFTKKYAMPRLRCQLINTKLNHERLKNVPHREFLDLSIVYRIVTNETPNETASILVTNDICDHLGIGEEELHRTAMEQTRNAGFVVGSMSNMLNSMLEEIGEEANIPDDVVNMYAMTNKSKLNGATVLLFPEQLEKLAMKLQSSLVLIPSSIHEILAVPLKEAAPSMTTAMIRGMIGNVNEKHVKDEEILGTNVYLYRLGSGEVEIMEE